MQRLRRPVDAASLGAFRAGFGLLMLVSMVRFFAKGWIAELYLEPQIFFPYWGFSWIAPWPGVGMYVHFAVLGVLATLIMVGLWSRVALGLFLLGFTYVELLDRTTYLNHYYLVSLLALLLMCMPVDQAFALRKPPESKRTGRVPAWTLYALRAQVGLVYLFAGLAKLRTDWLFRAEPLHTWLSVHTDLPWLGTLFADLRVAFAMAWLGALFDLFVVPLLLWKRSRPVAYLAVVLFHSLTGLLFPIGVFPFVMIVSATVFFEPNWPRRWLRPANRVPMPGPIASAPSASSTGERVVMALLGLHLLLQALIPIRHLFYPGNACWTEQGYRFSWHVMLMEKTGQVDFRVVDREGRQWTVFPREYLSEFQHRMMSTQPDMILSFAQYLARRWEDTLGQEVAVYADAWSSLNARPRQRLIDPEINLAKQREGWSHKSWVVPLRPMSRLSD